jgi:3-isopropylmalate/(R)-2-methylmalate dehydratase large subunit
MSLGGLTLVEKILGNSLRRPVRSGQIVVAPVDRVLLQDGTAPRVIERLRALQGQELKLAERTVLFVDHGAPPPSPEIAARQAELRRDITEFGFGFSPPGSGISHQRMVESYACPGEIIVGADSHTCTVGALGAVGLGMGSTDIACAIAMAECWLLVPDSIRVELQGRFEPGVCSKDLMLQIIGRLGAAGANYQSLEFAGEGLKQLSFDERLVLANLGVEVGAKTALMAVDAITVAYLERRGRPWTGKPVVADADASYTRHLKLDMSTQEPLVALPGRHDDIAPIGETEAESIDQVVIGSCTNGRASDFEAAAQILRGRTVDAGTRLVLAPASAAVLEETIRSGAMGALIEAGGTLVTPGCGPCVGIHQGVLGPGQRCVSTQSRNFPGRMGDPSSRVWLASPYTAAATAVTGRLTDPRELLLGT